MDTLSDEQLRNVWDRVETANDGMPDDSRVKIENFGCHQGEFILVSKWFALAELPQDVAVHPSTQAMRDFAWLPGLLACHFIRR